MLNYNKKAQLGETMTWAVATVIIVLILVFSLFISAKMGESKKIQKVFSDDYKHSTDLIMEKTIFVYFMLDKNQKDIVYQFLQEQGNKEAFYVDFESKLGEVESVLK